MTRGMKGCYVYCSNKELAEHFKKFIRAVNKEVIDEQLENTTQLRIEPEVNDDVKYIDYLALYSLKGACGTFGEWQVVDDSGWMKV